MNKLVIRISLLIIVFLGLFLYINSLYSLTFPSTSVIPESIFSKYEKSLNNLSNIESLLSTNNLEIKRILLKIKNGDGLIYSEYAILSSHIINKGTKLVSEVDSYTAIILERDYTQNTILDSLNQDLSYLTLYSATIRSFEDDVNSFITLMNASSIDQKSNEIIAINIIRRNLKEIYQQTLAMLNTRIKSISDNNISLANMRISIIALFVAFLSLLLSLDRRVIGKPSKKKSFSKENETLK